MRRAAAMRVAFLAAVAPHASWTQLSTANGRSAAVYDVTTARVNQFREHVYAQRTLDPATSTRQLMYDLYFGLRDAGSNAWLAERPIDEVGYDGAGGIIRVVQQQGNLVATQYFFTPFGMTSPALAAIVEVRNDGATPAADAALFSLHNLHLGGGASGADGETMSWVNGVYEERGLGSRLVLHVPLVAPTHHTTTPANPYPIVESGGRLSDWNESGLVDDAVAGFEWDLTGMLPGETRTYGLIITSDEAGSRDTLDAALSAWSGWTPAVALDGERAAWGVAIGRAAEPPGLTDDERAVYRRSLAVLRMAQSREADIGTTHPGGQIVASLPPGQWTRTWVRDQAYAVRALIRAGLYGEARAALAFLLEGRAGDYASYVGEPYALSVTRYTGDGGEESDANANGPNIELDGFGLTLGVLAEYVAASGDDDIVDTYADGIFASTADVLARRVDATGLIMADSSIWETHWDNGGRKHYAYTSAAAVWGLRGAAALAARRGDAAAAAGYSAAAAELTTAITGALIDPATGALRGSTEEPDFWRDAAVVEAFNWDVLPADGPAAEATLDLLRSDLWLGFSGNGYRRNDDGGEYDEREWIVVDLMIAHAARRAGREQHADELLAWVTDQARLNWDLLPENFHPLTGDYLGEVPMTGFGAAAYITALWARVPPTEPPMIDAGIDVPDAGGAPDVMGPPVDGGGDGCACNAGGRSTVPGGCAALLLGLAAVVPFARRRRHILHACLLLAAGCGIEGLFGGGGYDPTAPQRVRVSATAPAGTATVEAWDAADRLIASAPTNATAGVELDLGAADLANLRLVARDADAHVLARATLADAPAAADPLTVTLDSQSTSAAILVDARVAYDGLALGGTPSPVVAAMIALAAGDAQPLADFRAAVTALPAGALAPLGATLDPAWAAANPAAAAAYDAALAAAVTLVGVPIVCDPAFVRVMFAVDVSGQALDGNGARQLIRQPPKEGRVFLGFTVDDSSAVADAAGQLPDKLTPNDPAYAMFDDGSGGDEVAGDGIYTRVVTLPRGMRIIYKYTDGSAGEAFTRTEEWPGNARILAVDDVVTRHADGRPDCLVIRRDSFGDEASNKNFTSLAAGLSDAGGALGWDTDLGGAGATPLGDGRVAGGVDRLGPRSAAPLTPAGIPEARENGVCETCPAPLVLALDDTIPPTLLGASFLSTSEIEIRFSEAMDFAAASDPDAYLVVDSALRPLAVRAVAAVGDRVRLRVEGPDLAEAYTLYVRCLPDASAAHNPLECEGGDSAATSVGPDLTPPRPLLARAGSRKDLDPAATLADPTVGEVVAVTFTEEVDRASAEDVGRYRIESIFGQSLPVRGAFLVAPSRVLLVTDPQVKRQRYTVDVSGVRDFAGNPAPPLEPLPFDGFALYRMTFGVVPGHAFATLDGSLRGIPHGEKLYLTGTPLAVARAPQDGSDLSIGGRTDVTGVPELELLAGADQHAGAPIYTITILAPPGVYAWKAAHGVPGEWVDPPPTLVKVTKSLGTTNDPTGVNIDPVTLIARNGVSYDGAALSPDGADAPAPTVLFKRENPDEICAVVDADVVCPTIVVGTWRDLDDFTADYDDGQPEVPPIRLVPDVAPPAPIYVQVRDSESLRISFDEGIAAGATVQAAAAGADGPLAVAETRVGFPAPHEIVVRTATMSPGAPYTLTLTGLADDLGNVVPAAGLNIAWTSPSVVVPFTPFEDHDPPILLGVVPDGPTTLRVQFNEPLAPSAADPARFTIAPRGADSPPSILAAVLTGGDKQVLLTTTTQPLMGAFTLVAGGIADQASPANVLGTASVDFVGFGDLDPPILSSARAIGATTLVLVFDEPLDPVTASAAASYTVTGATVTGAEFSGNPALLGSAFDPGDARLTPNLVLVHTSPLTAGTPYPVTAAIRDLSGNLGGGSSSVTGVSAPPTVDVVIEYLISDTTPVAGAIPPRAISPSRLASEREGVFLVGIGGFPSEGSPLTGVEPQLLDDGAGADLTAGDHVFTITIPDVPLGSVLEWKAFASYTVEWKTTHPTDSAAAFADSLPGPAAFSDGQEFPGNENGALILGDLDGDGVLRLSNLFGDETTYKKLTMTAPFVWVVE